MNYVELINNFWKKDIEYNFSDKETTLYFYLLSISNSINWKNPFGLSNSMTIAKFGWGKKSFDTAKNNLQKAGLISFKPGDGRGHVYQYTIKDSEKAYQKAPLSAHLSDTLSEQKGATSINININKTSKEKDKDKKEKTKVDNRIERFTPPTVAEVAVYCQERNNGIDAQHFVDHYSANGWVRGKTQIKDWKACIRTWEKNNFRNKSKNTENGRITEDLARSVAEGIARANYQE